VQRDTPLRDAAPQVVPIPRLPGTLPPLPKRAAVPSLTLRDRR
jgi:hypothetical protein